MKKALAAFFLVGVLGLAAALIWVREKPAALTKVAAPAPADTNRLHEASWYDKLPDGMVHCRLCPNSCRLPEGALGLCRARQNIGGTLYSLVYGQMAAVHVDPIEKKPFFHVLPGGRAFSLATSGCNMRCLFCQNWEISQALPGELQTTAATPEEVVAAAVRSGAQAIAFTYNEPTIFYEYMLDIARLAKARGLKTLVISNGYIQPEPLRALLPHIDAYKVDFKAFSPQFYTEVTGGSREPILETMKIIHEAGVWLEIVNLLITGLNDSEDEVRELARWVRDNLGPDVPVHFTRFHPLYKLANLPPTPIERIVRAREIALAEGLHYVYTGNIPSSSGDSTYSPQTGEVLIRRQGFFVLENRLTNGVAPSGEVIPGVWQ